MQTLYYICFSCLLLCFSCNQNNAEEKANSVAREHSVAETDNSLLQKAFIKRCAFLEITPVDESGADTSLLHFIMHLKKVVQQKDTALLMELIDHNMVTSHGGLEIGKKDFIEHWELKKNPSESLVWERLERAIALGGCFDRHINKPEFIMPYLQASHYFKNGCDFD
jgi:hypothetical protein